MAVKPSRIRIWRQPFRHKEETGDGDGSVDKGNSYDVRDMSLMGKIQQFSVSALLQPCAMAFEGTDSSE